MRIKLKYIANLKLYLLSIAIVGVVVSLSIEFARAAFTAPTATAPGNNIAGPITAAGAQKINGTLGIGTSVDSGIDFQVKNSANNTANVRIGANSTSLGQKRLKFGDGEYVYVGESATEDDTLEIRANKINFIGSTKIPNIEDLINPVVTADPTWERVYDKDCAPGSGNQACWSNSVSLDPNRRLLGIRMSAYTDDGGVCIAYIPGYFAGAVTFNAFLSSISTAGNWNGMAWNRGHGWTNTTEFIFKDLSGGSYPGEQSYTLNSPYAMAKGATGPITSIAGNKTLWVDQWYNDGGGAYDNHCYIDALYRN